MTEFTDRDNALMDLVLSHGLVFPQGFKDRLRDAILDGLRGVNYKNVPGMGALRGQVRTPQFEGTAGAWSAGTGGVYAKFSTSTVGTHTDYLMSGIANGKYLIFFEALMSSGANGARLGLSVNGDTPSDAEAAFALSVSTSQHVQAIVRRLASGDNNTLEMMVKSSGGSTIVDNPRILIIKLAD